MAGGQRIDDHSSWIGGKSKDSVLPAGNKVKHYSSAEGEGAVARYDDTSERIKVQQLSSSKKIKSHPMTDSNRN